MKKYTLNHILYTVLQLTWGLFQNLLGILLWLILTVLNPSRERSYYHGAIVSHWKFPFSMGLGMFIFYGHKGSRDADRVLVHEYGHTIQSIILGPLFFFVIALPSVTWAFLPAFQRRRREKGISYMNAYCESWANYEGERITHLPAPSPLDH